MNGQTHDFAGPDTLTIARDLLARGYKPLPIPLGAKNPILSNWQNLSITAENVTHYFNGAPQNVGVQMGRVSGGLADVDLDCNEAVKLAPTSYRRHARFTAGSARADHIISTSAVTLTPRRRSSWSTMPSSALSNCGSAAVARAPRAYGPVRFTRPANATSGMKTARLAQPRVGC